MATDSAVISFSALLRLTASGPLSTTLWVTSCRVEQSVCNCPMPSRIVMLWASRLNNPSKSSRRGLISMGTGEDFRTASMKMSKCSTSAVRSSASWGRGGPSVWAMSNMSTVLKLGTVTVCLSMTTLPLVSRRGSCVRGSSFFRCTVFLNEDGARILMLFSPFFTWRPNSFCHARYPAQ